MLEIRQILHDGGLGAEGMAVVFNSYTENLEEMHANGGDLDPGLGLEHDIYGTCEERDECVALAGGDEDAQEFELQDFAHRFESG